MTQTPLAASVVVPSRGGVRRLPILLGALHRQDREDFEVVLVLDGDIDRSRQAAERFRASFGDRLRIVEFPENRGRVAALNAGFEKAQGHVLIRCDDDFEPSPGYVDAHVTAHAQPTAVGGGSRTAAQSFRRYSLRPRVRACARRTVPRGGVRSPGD